MGPADGGAISKAAVAAQRGPTAGQPGHLDAPFRPTPAPLVERLLDLAGVGSGDRLIDLGCGDGRILLAAARRGAEACGIDRDAARIAQAQAAAEAAGLADRIRLSLGDLFDADLHGFDVVTLFLLPHVNRWLEPKLMSELAPGARIVGSSFPMPHWAPAAVEDHEHTKLYLWRR